MLKVRFQVLFRTTTSIVTIIKEWEIFSFLTELTVCDFKFEFCFVGEGLVLVGFFLVPHVKLISDHLKNYRN
jgi:hypothetical protein